MANEICATFNETLLSESFSKKMSSVWPANFGSDILNKVQLIRQGLFGGNVPSVLYHYTNLEGVLGIGRSRVFRATSANDLEDQAEIQHGIDVVCDEIDRKHNSRKTNWFVEGLLNAIPNAIGEGKKWTFVVCFCPEGNSGFHLKRYGKYCLQVRLLEGSAPQLKPPQQDWHADVRLQHVSAIYVPDDFNSHQRSDVLKMLEEHDQSDILILSFPP